MHLYMLCGREWRLRAKFGSELVELAFCVERRKASEVGVSGGKEKVPF